MSILGNKKNRGRVSIIIIGLTDQLKSTVKMSSERLGEETEQAHCVPHRSRGCESPQDHPGMMPLNANNKSIHKYNLGPLLLYSQSTKNMKRRMRGGTSAGLPQRWTCLFSVWRPGLHRVIWQPPERLSFNSKGLQRNVWNGHSSHF